MRYPRLCAADRLGWRRGQPDRGHESPSGKCSRLHGSLRVRSAGRGWPVSATRGNRRNRLTASTFHVGVLSPTDPAGRLPRAHGSRHPRRRLPLLHGHHRRGPTWRTGGIAANAERPRVIAGRQGSQTHGWVGASAGGRDERDDPHRAVAGGARRDVPFVGDLHERSRQELQWVGGLGARRGSVGLVRPVRHRRRGSVVRWPFERNRLPRAVVPLRDGLFRRNVLAKTASRCLLQSGIFGSALRARFIVAAQLSDLRVPPGESAARAQGRSRGPAFDFRERSVAHLLSLRR